MKTVRFAQVVARGGKPRVHTLWLAPGKDPELARALKAHRVMTVRSPRGKTDVGEVGFDPEAARDGAPFQLLIFPQSLARFAGARVVGIKFDLVEQPKLVPATPSPPASRGAIRVRKPGRGQRPRQPPQPASAPTAPAAIRSHRPATPGPKAAARQPAATSPRALAHEVRAALEELEQGKSVAAYRRLQQALTAG